jgi:hypothetical protein
MKSINDAFDEYCTKYQTRYAMPEIARTQSAEAFFAGAAAMGSLFAEGNFQFLADMANLMAERSK